MQSTSVPIATKKLEKTSKTGYTFFRFTVLDIGILIIAISKDLKSRNVEILVFWGSVKAEFSKISDFESAVTFSSSARFRSY